MVVRKFPILVLSVFSWETWQKRLIGFPSMAVNNQSQMREAAGQHCFLKGGGGVWGKLVRKQGFIVLPAVLFTPSIRKIDSMNSGVGAD